MFKILIPVDGSSYSDRAVSHVIDVIQAVDAREPIEVLLLNVREPVDAWEVRRFLPTSEIEAMQESEGGDAMRSARALLDAAKIHYTPEVLIGPVAETIARFANENDCHLIVMGTRGLGAFEGILLGSVASKVVHLADAAVTLVK
jgi:nucleotide-binding universal stress UspA family protein